ncbi:hypothetical protein MNEG_7958 [Monoraphidium neglectum]|uniref:Uncharacterized protein n=1 Tax=Monoraphidium neglectum TaxID=145388 RepID=A0A0D2N127_9CHLO|nr:hypothetical protein MNEG_7958 [Monoraphidium neglectum]KIZ00001.1 hypothetical protein MNEG_7958 [Monoraphidium neglectum]|eukprot:XP_013899020.1 hypothetical protein MNEG_7958 [Monoraphidium neglectum]
MPGPLASMTAAMYEPRVEFCHAAPDADLARPQPPAWPEWLPAPQPGPFDLAASLSALGATLRRGALGGPAASDAAAAPAPEPTPRGALAAVDTSNTLPLTLPASAAPGSAAPGAGAGAGIGAEHSLVAVGCRHWLAGKVKIYDFAVYADAREARAALAGAFTDAAAGGVGTAARESRGERRRRRRATKGANKHAGEAAGADAAGLEAAQFCGDDGKERQAAASWWQPLQLSLGWWPQDEQQQQQQQEQEQQEQQQARAGAAPLEDAGATQHAACARRPRRLLPRRSRKQPPRLELAAAHSGDAAPHAPGGGAAAAAAAGLPAALKSSGDCGVSLLLRAARDIPLGQLRDEYEKVLKRRLERVGGDPSDPALAQLLGSFTDPRRLPAAAVAGGGSAVRRGASIVFTRQGPVVEARVG